MKRIALFTALSLALVGPAIAAPTPVRSAEVWHDINELDRSIDRADQRDTISEREAAGLRAQVRALRDSYHQLNRGGLTPAEARSLEQRIERLNARLGNERHDADHHRS